MCCLIRSAHRVRCVLVTRAKFALTVPKWKQTARNARTWQHLPVSATVSAQGDLTQGGQRTHRVGNGSKEGVCRQRLRGTASGRAGCLSGKTLNTQTELTPPEPQMAVCMQLGVCVPHSQAKEGSEYLKA